MSFQLTRRRCRRPVLIPNRIRTYRVEAGLSQRGLGRLVGHSRSLISTWERGQRLPTTANLFVLARALDTLTESLYYGLYQKAGRVVQRRRLKI